MGDVIQGKWGQKQEIVYQCPHCGVGQSFWIDEGGSITCRTCKAKQVAPSEWLEDATSYISDETEEE